MENRILLVQDDASLRRSLESFLERAGYAFSSCSTAREALAVAETLRHDVAVVEYHLPDASGATLLERLSQIDANVVAVMVSAYDYQAIVDELVRVDVHSYLKKPFDPVELEVALSSAFAKVRMSRGVVPGGRNGNVRKRLGGLSMEARGLVETKHLSGARMVIGALAKS